MEKEKTLYVIIHNIRSAYNVGAVFRTADGAGVKKIFLSGYTPTPYFDEAYPTRAQKMIAKTALEAERVVPWEREKDIIQLIEKLRSKGVEIIGLENGVKSIDYKDFQPKFPSALILGTEVTGIDQEILSQCEVVISIPMRGKKESLNVSVASGIAIYEILS